MALFTWSAAFIGVCLVVIIKLAWNFMNQKPKINPFANDSRIPLKPKVTNHKDRDSVLKQGFHISKVPEQLDAIVIGSGIGGLSVAAILSKAGKRVLVLEQHDQAGGCCHTFIDKGYEFDVGIHYIGGMVDGTLSKTYLDQISQGQILWEPMDDNFDVVVFKSPNPEETRRYPVCKGHEEWKLYLKEKFPTETAGIDRFFEVMQEATWSVRSSVILKFLPLWIIKILEILNILQFVSKFYSLNKRTLKSFVEEIVKDEDLRDIFCYNFMDYGTPPSRAGIPIQMLLHSHYLHKGAFYPTGGPSEIAFHIIPVIESAGGKVLVRAKVTEVLVDASANANGVRVQHGSSSYELFAPLIISDAGICNTFHKLLPSHLAKQCNLWPIASKDIVSASCLSVFVGLDCSAEELNIPMKNNYWVYLGNDIDKLFMNYYDQSDMTTLEDSECPLLFVSFPSTKDPTWNERYPGKTTMVVITIAKHSWFAEWEKQPATRRGDEYEMFKKVIGHKIINHATELFPDIKNHIDFVSVGTPLSNQFYLGSSVGEIYGLDHNQQRFSAPWFAQLRPDTGIPGLYLTGQDVLTAGFIGGLHGGLLCAQAVLGNHIYSNLIALHKQLKKEKFAKAD